MNRFRAALAKKLDEAIDAARTNIPAAQIRDQLIGGSGGVLPPGGNTGSGYSPAAHDTAWADVTGTPTTLAGYGITDAASDAELAAHEADTTSVHGIADTSTLYRAGGTDVALADGGTGASLTDPNADRILFWDDSAGQLTWLTAGTNLTITGTTIDASGGGGSSLTVEEADGSPTDSAVTKIVFPNGTLSISSHEATYTPATVAPVDATYITQTANGTLTNEQALGALATGILKNTTTTGVLSIATGADLPSMVASGASHSGGAVPDPGASSGSTKYLREDATWATPSGTGAPADATYITLTSDGTLSAETVRPELYDASASGGSDIDMSGASTGTGVTASSANGLYTLVWTNGSWQYWDVASAIGTGDFDVRVRLVDLGVTQGTNTSNQALIRFALGDSSRTHSTELDVQVNGPSPVSTGINLVGGVINDALQGNWRSNVQFPLILRMTRSGTTVTFYASQNEGRFWMKLGTATSSLNIAKIGMQMHVNSQTEQQALIHWVRSF